jgi:hypothetical protein
MSINKSYIVQDIIRNYEPSAISMRMVLNMIEKDIDYSNLVLTDKNFEKLMFNIYEFSNKNDYPLTPLHQGMYKKMFITYFFNYIIDREIAFLYRAMDLYKVIYKTRDKTIIANVEELLKRTDCKLDRNGIEEILKYIREEMRGSVE